MQTMNRVFDAALDEDLRPLSVYWWQHKLAHQITEQSGRQVVWAAEPQHGERLLADYLAFRDGNLKITLQRREPAAPHAHSAARVFRFIAHSPITLLLVALSIAGFLLVEFDTGRRWVDWLTIQAVGSARITETLYAVARISPQAFFAQDQYWRMITPIFLHFGWLHIIFNMIWLWELGRRIEQQGGSLHFASIVFFIGATSNLYQAASTPYAYFGGMSGVIFGLLGYCAVFNFIAPKRLLKLPKEYYVVMLLTLVIGWFGWLDSIARMANTAHTAGFFWGCFIALPSALLVRFTGSREPPH